MENILKTKGMLCNVIGYLNGWYSVIQQKMTVIYSIYFPALSYLVFVFVYNFVGKNNHDCLEVMQSLYYKSSSKHVLKSVRHRKKERKGHRP